MRSRSRWKAGRTSSSASGRRRPRDLALLAAWGASMSSRASSCSRMLVIPSTRTPQNRREESYPAGSESLRLRRDLRKETGTVRQGTDAEDLRERLAQIGKGRSCAEVGAAADLRARDDERHILARVIGARRRRIVAMVSRDDEQIVLPKAGKDSSEPRVEPLEILRVSLDVVAMAVLRVEIHEVGEDEAALHFVHLPLDLIHAVVVARRVDGAGDAPAGEEVLDLADGNHRQRRGLDPIEQCFAERRQREIAP